MKEKDPIGPSGYGLIGVVRQSLLDCWDTLKRSEMGKGITPTHCIMGYITYLEFEQALKIKYAGLPMYETDKSGPMEYQGVVILVQRGDDYGMVFGGIERE